MVWIAGVRLTGGRSNTFLESRAEKTRSGRVTNKRSEIVLRGTEIYVIEAEKFDERSAEPSATYGSSLFALEETQIFHKSL